MEKRFSKERCSSIAALATGETDPTTSCTVNKAGRATRLLSRYLFLFVTFVRCKKYHLSNLPVGIMRMIVVLMVFLTVTVTLAEECPNPATCPCGSKGGNVTVCVSELSVRAEVCVRLSRCEDCEDGYNFCTKCPEGLDGPTCSPEISKSRQKRQSAARGSYGRLPAAQTVPSSCSNLDSPKFGSKRCVPRDKPRSCTGKCYPGYYFVNSELDEMTLTCRGGIWIPRSGISIFRGSFPDCTSAGHCDLVNKKGGKANCTTSIDGTKCEVHCNDRFMGRYSCYPGSSWTPTLPSCVKPKVDYSNDLFCDNPGPVANGKVKYFAPGTSTQNPGKNLDEEIDEFAEGSELEYSCDEKFLLKGSRLLRCDNSGFWSDKPPLCVLDNVYDGLYCDNPKSIPNGNVRYFAPGLEKMNDTGANLDSEQDEFPEGSVMEYSCDEGFWLQGSPNLICEASGFWSDEEPTCVAADDEVYCAKPGRVLNGRVRYFEPGIIRSRNRPGESQDYQLDEYEVGSELQFSCDEGFTLRGSGILECQSTGFWSAERPTCIGDSIHCKYPGDVENGRIVHIPSSRRRPSSNQRQEEYSEGSTLQYSCEDGYIQRGPTTLTCSSTGTWSGTPPTCLISPETGEDEDLNCDNPGRVLNGRTSYHAPGQSGSTEMGPDNEMDEYPAGSVLEYSCDKGFQLQGTNNLTCESTGFWSAERPRCDGDCGRSFVKSSVRIRDGQETVIGEWPWVVSISLMEEGRSRFLCGGAVFNTRTVVTAAHCLEVDRTYILRFGKHHFRIENDDPNVLVRTSSRVVIHPDYSRRTLDSDIGLVMFEESIEYSARVQPICLPTFETTVRNIRKGRVGYVSGWGDTEMELPSNKLLFAGLPILSTQDCMESYRKQNLTVTVTGNMFCAGYHNGTYSVCGGDSGSPFVFYDNLRHRYTLEGLVSFVVRRRTDAQACGLPGRFAIFTKVFRFVPWMYQNIE